MKRKYGKSRSMHEAVSPVQSAVRPPAPPTNCSGFIYTVQRGDSMFFIAQRFGITLERLIAANPQISDPSMIFIGQRICVPTKKPHPPHPQPPHPPRPPEAVEVEFLGRDGRPIPVVDGVIKLPRHVTVRARFPMPIHEAFLFFSPAGQPFEQTRLIEAKKVPRTNIVEFVWQVPSNIRGTVFVIGCEGANCRKSREYRVVSER